MQSDAPSVDEYLTELSDDRRKTISEVRSVITKSLNKGFEEGMQYGMIGYFVPHSIYPDGYHAKPTEPLPFLSLASQKNYCSLYAMPLYSDERKLQRFKKAWGKSGKKLSMGKSCIRFKSCDDLALDVIADHISSITVDQYVSLYEKIIERKK